MNTGYHPAESGTAAAGDDALLRRARAQDPEALEALYRATSPAVWRTVCAMVRQEQDAMDVMQDTYLKAFSRLDQLQSAEALGPWLRQIAANTARDHLRRKKPLLFSELQKEDDLLTEPEDDRTDALPEAKLDRRETQRLVREMMDTLTDAQRLVIGMYYEQELPIREIADQLGLPQATVKSQLRYGRQKIEKQVRKLEQQGVKLYGAAPLAFFRLLFRQSLRLAEAPEPADALPGELLAQSVPARSAVIKAVAAKSLLIRRLILGAAALAAVGGVTAGVLALRGRSHAAGDVRPPQPSEVSLAGQTDDSPEELTLPRTETPEDLQTVPTDPEPTVTQPYFTEPPEDPETVPTAPEPTEVPDETDEPGFPTVYLEETPAAYVELLRQYRAAALDEIFEPENYPLVDAEAIETLQGRWAAYTDDGCSLGIRFADLDNDGLEEMELRLINYVDYKEYTRSTPFLRLYTQRDGQPVELLSGEETGFTATMEYFEGGYILCWENGRYTSPCQLTVYQLLPGQTELTALHRWTCTLDELGLSQFVSEDGAQTWTLAYFDANNNRYTGDIAGPTFWRACFLDKDGSESEADVPYFPELPMEDFGIAGEITWREVKQESARGYPEQVPLFANPGTDAAQAVVPLADVMPEYSTENVGEQIQLWDSNKIFPYITLPGAGFEEFNQRIQAEAAEVLTWSDSSIKEYFVEHGAYDWALNGDILSVITYEYAGGGYTFPTVYNFSVSEGRRLSDSELLDRLGVDPARFRAAARDALHGRYLNDWEYRPASTDGMCAIAHAVVLEHLDKLQITLGRNGTLIVFGIVGSCAGGMEYTRCVPVYP